MSKYTTGELAKRCNVTVRTVQYYDTRGILNPSELSEGGRRLYTEDDLKRLKVICFLRELDIPIDAISQILREEQPEQVVSLLIEQQENALLEELSEKQGKLEKLRELKSGLKNGLKSRAEFSIETIGDIAEVMKDRKKLKRLRRTMLLTGIPAALLQWGSLLFWIISGIGWPFAVGMAAAIVWGVLVSRYYIKNVKYLCPECHRVFRPGIKELLLARHTPTTRRLTCTECGHKGFCVEIWGGDHGNRKEEI